MTSFLSHFCVCVFVRMPILQKTIRLVVNYHRSQKTVVRVNPLAPLHTLVPIICQKCEFDPTHVLLLRDSVSRHELDLNKSLSDLEIRELYALDQSLGKHHPPSAVLTHNCVWSYLWQLHTRL